MDLATCNTDTAFAELIYADAQWLREEFDALIAASFGQPPGRAATRATTGSAAPAPPGSATLAATAAPSPRYQQDGLTVPGQRRPRSPPA